MGPADRIKWLESLVRSLGGDPDDNATFNSRPHSAALSRVSPEHQSPHDRQGQASPSDSRSKDPVILEEDGHQYYLES